MISKRHLSYLAILIAAFFWGTSYSVVKIGLSILDPPIPPMGYLTIRFALALVLLSPLLLHSNTRSDFLALLKSKYIIIMGLINGGSFILQFLGQTGTPAAIATLLINTNLITTPILSSIVLHEEITNKLKISVVLGFIGAVIASLSVFPSDVSTQETFIFIVNTLLVLIAGLSWGGYAVVSRILNKKAIDEGKQEMNNAIAAFGASNFYSVFLMSISMLLLNQVPISLTAESWIAIIYLGVFCTLIPFVLYIFASQMIPATELNVITLLNVIVGLFLAVFLLSENLSILGIFGSFLIILSIFLASTEELKTNF